MRIEIAVENDEAEWLESLYQWLKIDQRVPADAEVSLHAANRPGRQGGVFDLISLIISDTVGMGGLALSYVTWRRQAREAPSITISSGGRTISVSGGSAEDIQKIFESLLPDEPDDPESGE